MNYRKLTFWAQILSCSIFLGFTHIVTAEEDFDLDFDFSVHQKSTISDFPFQEIGQVELSNAAIAGALQTMNTAVNSGSGKPVFVEKQEKNEKKLKSEVEIDDDPLSEENILTFSQLLRSPPQFQAPIYQQDLYRTLKHENITVERP